MLTRSDLKHGFILGYGISLACWHGHQQKIWTQLFKNYESWGLRINWQLWWEIRLFISNWQFCCNCCPNRQSQVVPSASSICFFSCSPHPNSPQPKPHHFVWLLYLLIYPPFNTQLWAYGTPCVNIHLVSLRLGEDLLNCCFWPPHRDLQLLKYSSGTTTQWDLNSSVIMTFEGIPKSKCINTKTQMQKKRQMFVE